MSKTMLYTKDAELAVSREHKPQKGVFLRGKLACFYSTFDDADVDEAIAAGWLPFDRIAEKADEPAPADKPRRGRPPKSATEDAGNDASGHAG